MGKERQKHTKRVRGVQCNTRRHARHGRGTRLRKSMMSIGGRDKVLAAFFAKGIRLTGQQQICPAALINLEVQEVVLVRRTVTDREMGSNTNNFYQPPSVISVAHALTS